MIWPIFQSSDLGDHNFFRSTLRIEGNITINTLLLCDLNFIISAVKKKKIEAFIANETLRL